MWLPDWTVTEWAAVAQTCVSAAALVAALYAGIIARRLLRNDDDREDARVEASNREQAALVSAWIGRQQHPALNFLGFYVWNASRAPVWDARAFVYVGEARVAEFELHTIPPTDDPAFTRLPREAVDAVRARTRTPTGELASLTSLGVEVEFWDSNSVRWRRDAMGKLQFTGH